MSEAFYFPVPGEVEVPEARDVSLPERGVVSVDVPMPVESAPPVVPLPLDIFPIESADPPVVPDEFELSPHEARPMANANTTAVAVLFIFCRLSAA